MRSLVTSVTTLVFLVLASTLASTKPGCAGTIINVCGKFSFSVPDDWKEAKESTSSSERTTYESPDGKLYLVVGPLADKSADIADDDVTDVVDEELDDMKVTADKRDTLEKFNIRVVEGTGEDEGDPVAFKLLALDPGSTDGVLTAFIYGDPKAMTRTGVDATIDQILRSLRPH